MKTAFLACVLALGLPTPAAPPTSSPTRPAATRPAQEAARRPTFGRSHDQILDGLDGVFALDKGVMGDDGLTHYTAFNKERGLILSLAGDKNDVSEVRLIFGVPNDQKQRAENDAYVVRLLVQAVPGWEECQQWLKDNGEVIAREPFPTARLTSHGKVIAMFWIKEVKGVGIIVRPEQPAQ